MLLLTNNNESSYFFFNHSAFKDELWTMISRNVIQIDFKEKYEVIDQIGKGSFSKVGFYINIGLSRKEPCN